MYVLLLLPKGLSADEAQVQQNAGRCLLIIGSMTATEDPTVLVYAVQFFFFFYKVTIWLYVYATSLVHTASHIHATL